MGGMDSKTGSKIDLDSWEEKKIRINGYIKLAAAIVESGKKCGDRVFLEGLWCKELTQAVLEWRQVNDSRNVKL